MVKFAIVHERAKMSPFIPWAMMQTFATGLNDVIGSSMDPLYLAYDSGSICAVTTEESLNELIKNGVKKIKKNPNYVQELIEIFTKKIKVLNQFAKKVHCSDLSKKSNEELFEIYSKWYKLYYDSCKFGEPISWPLRFEFVNELQKEVEKKLKDKSKLHECITTFITPNELSFVNKSEKEILKIAIEISKDESSYSLFSKPVSEIMKKLQTDFPNLDRKLRDHVDAFCWIPFDYESDIWDKEYFVREIKQLLASSVDIKRKLKSLVDAPVRYANAKKKMYDEIGLDKKTIKYFEAIAESGYLLDFKKEQYSKAHYNMKSWVEEVAKRLNITTYQLRMMLPIDLEKALLHNEINASELDERYRYSVYFLSRENTKIFYKKEAKKLFNQFKKQVDYSRSEITGLCAQPGTVRGVARVLLSSTDSKNMQDGDVLITSMTTPDFVPAMKKARAIITDEGGITCHAAIVSRELGTPCVVGTKIATNFFKTGDIIEIHAASGIVRKLGTNT